MPDGAVARRNARLYLAGLTASLIGNSAMSLVAGVWVKSLTGSNARAGLVSACVYAPSLAAPLAGLLADRVDRRRWLVGINLVSAGSILILLTVRSSAQVWVIFVAMGLYGCEIILADPAEDALFAEMLPPPLRRHMNGRRLAIQETGRLVAPLLGAGLFALIGGGAVAALDAATFLVAAAAVWRLRLPRRRRPPAREPWASALVAGARHIRATSELWSVAAATTGVMAISGLGVAAQYGLLDAVHKPPAFLGVLTALLGAGSILAAVWSPRLIASFGEARVAVIGLVNFAVGELLRAMGWLPSALLGSLVLGFALPFVFLAVLSLAQRSTPIGLQGRVSAAISLALFGPQAPMQAAGSLAIAHASFRTIFFALAVAAGLIAVWLGRAGLVQADSRPGQRRDVVGQPDHEDQQDQREPDDAGALHHLERNPLAPDLLGQSPEHVAAVEWEEREQVDDPERQRNQRKDPQSLSGAGRE
jgi:Transmembrane secretion effector